MYFKGSKQPGHQALLTWQTAGEYNAASFEVEKSEDATTFKQLADVSAYNSPASYKFVDEDFFKDAYYRLKIKDIDGTFEYSSIISLQQGDRHALAMYPNPVVNGILYVQNDGKEDWVQLYNASGNRIKILPLGQGLNVLNVQDLPSQTYLVRTKHSAVSVFVQNH